MSIFNAERSYKTGKRRNKVKDTSTVGQLIAKVVAGSVLAIYCVTLLIPVIWLIYSSFKTDMDYINNIWSLPKVWVVDNYTDVLQKLTIKRIKADGIYEFGLGSMLFTFLLRFTPGGIGRFCQRHFRIRSCEIPFPREQVHL